MDTEVPMPTMEVPRDQPMSIRGTVPEAAQHPRGIPDNPVWSIPEAATR